MKQERSADRRKYHIIYKTTCRVTGKYYVGMHSTDNLADGYIGSGKRLWQSIRKHGVEHHFCEVLEHLPSREALRLREAELVNEQLLTDKQCMNLALGGEGDWQRVTKSRGHEATMRASTAGKAKLSELMKDPAFKEQFCLAVSSAAKRNGFGVGKSFTAEQAASAFKGKSHTRETKRLIAEKSAKANAGAGNPAFGMKWVTNGVEVKRQAASLPLQDGWRFGRKL